MERTTNSAPGPRELEDEGALTVTFTVTVKPNGNWYVNGKVRRRASRAMAEIAEALAWLEWKHEQRHMRRRSG